MELETTKEQTQDENSDSNNNQPENTYEINGQNMTPEQLIESYNNLQGEFTKKSQKLSEYEKQGLEKDKVQETAEENKKAEKIKEEEEVFNTFKSDFTTLSEYQFKTIRDLQAINTDKSFEDIAKSYGMLDEAQLERSKSNKTVMGNSIGVKGNNKNKVELSQKAVRIHNIKSSEKLAEIRSNFGL